MTQSTSTTKEGVDEGIAEEGELFATHIGGSAVPEGVMMRGRLNWAVAVRTPSGDIHAEAHDLAHPARTGMGWRDWRRWPVIRGCVAFVESMTLSFKAMDVSSRYAYDDEEASAGDSDEIAGGVETFESQTSPNVASATTEKEDAIPPWMYGSLVVGLVLGIVLFVVAPAFLTNLIMGDYSAKGAIAWNLVDAAFRVAIFVGYIAGIRLFPDMFRLFRYHGAEHETIHCYEHGEDLTPTNAARFSCLHVRCGTAFMIMTMIIAIVVNTLIPIDAIVSAWGITSGAGRLAVVMVSRIVMIPVVAGLAYEVTVKWAGSHPENPLVKVLLWPGMMMQRLTTAKPDKGMLECAITALEMVADREACEGAIR